MKTLILILITTQCYSQELISTFTVKPTSTPKKWYSTSKNDLYIMGIQVVVGYAQGWREEVLYHNYQLRQNFPGLFSDFWGDFWDGRVWREDKQFDADHWLKSFIIQAEVVCVAIHVGDFKGMKFKHVILKVLFDSAKYYIFYKAGFTLGYNLTHGNKLF